MSNIWRVRTIINGGSGASQLATHYFDQAAGGTAQAAANAVRSFWDSLKNNLHSSYTFQVDQAVEDIDVATGQPTGLTAVTAAVVTGADSSDPLPWATQGLAEWRTGVYLGGREIRGRTFIPGNVEENNVLGVPKAIFVAQITTSATTLASDPLSSLCVYSTKKRAIGVVTAGQGWDKWAVLRSRRD